MKSEKKNQCCQDCKKGKTGENLSCQAKLMFEELQKKKELAKHKES